MVLASIAQLKTPWVLTQSHIGVLVVTRVPPNMSVVVYGGIAFLDLLTTLGGWKEDIDMKPPSRIDGHGVFTIHGNHI